MPRCSPLFSNAHLEARSALHVPLAAGPAGFPRSAVAAAAAAAAAAPAAVPDIAGAAGVGSLKLTSADG